MNDAALVGVLHGPRQGAHQGGGARSGPRRAVEFRVQAAPRDELHRQVRGRRDGADLEDLHDVRVL
jgi:hypothetical protein